MSYDVRSLLRSDALRALEAYWRSKMHGQDLPARRDIDPWEMRSFLPQVFLITVTRNPMRFWFRLVGTGVAEGYGEDMSGKYLDEIDLDELHENILEDYERAVISAQPVYSQCDYFRKDHKHLCYERLLLPLSSDGKTVDMLLGGAVLIEKDRLGEQSDRV